MLIWLKGYFKGKAGESLFSCLHLEIYPKRIFAIRGLTKREVYPDKMRQASAKAGQEMRSRGIKTFAMQGRAVMP